MSEIDQICHSITDNLRTILTPFYHKNQLSNEINDYLTRIIIESPEYNKLKDKCRCLEEENIAYKIKNKYLTELFDNNPNSEQGRIIMEINELNSENKTPDTNVNLIYGDTTDSTEETLENKKLEVCSNNENVSFLLASVDDEHEDEEDNDEHEDDEDNDEHEDDDDEDDEDNDETLINDGEEQPPIFGRIADRVLCAFYTAEAVEDEAEAAEATEAAEAATEAATEAAEAEESTVAETAEDDEEEDDEEEDEEEDEDEDEEEVEQITISDVDYYTNDSTNGTIYSCMKNGDVGDSIGSFVNEVPIFY